MIYPALGSLLIGFLTVNMMALLVDKKGEFQVSLINCARCNRPYYYDIESINRLCSTECEKKLKHGICIQCSLQFIIPAGSTRKTCSAECARERRVKIGKMCP